MAIIVFYKNYQEYNQYKIKFYCENYIKINTYCYNNKEEKNKKKTLCNDCKKNESLKNLDLSINCLKPKFENECLSIYYMAIIQNQIFDFKKIKININGKDFELKKILNSIDSSIVSEDYENLIKSKLFAQCGKLLISNVNNIHLSCGCYFCSSDCKRKLFKNKISLICKRCNKLLIDLALIYIFY